jgi:hypothetical protein
MAPLEIAADMYQTLNKLFRLLRNVANDSVSTGAPAKQEFLDARL